MSEATYSTQHPHEPEIPPALDGEGRCLVCGLLVRLDDERAVRRQLAEAVTRMWKGHDMKWGGGCMPRCIACEREAALAASDALDSERTP